MKHPVAISLLFAASLTPAANLSADETAAAECRGIAAAVVAGMRAAGEVEGQAPSQAAILAARRACAAARDELTIPERASKDDSAATQQQTVAASESNDDEKKSIWDFLPSNDDRKPGNDRLRRLKAQ